MFRGETSIFDVVKAGKVKSTAVIDGASIKLTVRSPPLLSSERKVSKDDSLKGVSYRDDH